MSVSHVSPTFGFGRHTVRRTRTALQRQHRIDLIFGAVGLVLFALLVVGIVGIATTVHPTDSPTAGYGTDGAAYVNPPHLAILWLWVTLMDVVAIIGFGIGAAVQHQK